MDAPINPHDPHLDTRQGRPFRGAAHHEPRSDRNADPFDTLADLFLGPPVRVEATSPSPLRLVGDPAADRSQSSEPRMAKASSIPIEAANSATTIEGLVLGHLPVFASAWATQYAKHVSQFSNESVAFLRFTGDRASLDLYVPGARDQSPIQRGSTLDEAIAVAAKHTSRWIVRLPDACEPELADAPIDCLTLLTGADEAAVVACYRTLKSLSTCTDDPEHDSPRSEELGDLAWRVAIMGADPLKAEEAGKKVRRAAEAFLDAALDISPCVARIGALRSSLLFDGTSNLGWRDAIALIRTAPPPEPAPPNRPTRSFGAPAPRVETRPRSSDPPSEDPRQNPSPSSQESQSGSVSSIPGLVSTQIRCPTCPAVDFAIDERGRLHLIARSGTADSIASLLSASSWARQHASLLLLAESRIREPNEPVLHYISSEPASDRRLLDTQIRVHAAARVGNQTAIIDLN